LLERLITRFAPTPSGYLHEGNLFSFLITWVYAKRTQGKIILRIDDADAQRTKKEFIEDIFNGLHFFGLDYDYGTRNLQELEQKYSQTLRTQWYFEELKSLAQKKLIYGCECSRKKVIANTNLFHSPVRAYPGTCRSKGLEYPSYPLRFYNPNREKIELFDEMGRKEAYGPERGLGDEIVWTRANQPAYQWFSLLEDVKAGINFIVRGKDLLSSSLFQIKLAQAIGNLHFPRVHFLHHGLLFYETSKLSKSRPQKRGYSLIQKYSHPRCFYSWLANCLGLEGKNHTTPKDFIHSLKPNHWQKDYNIPQ